MKYIVIVTLSYLTAGSSPSASRTDAYGRTSNKHMVYAVMTYNTQHKVHEVQFTQAARDNAFSYYNGALHEMNLHKDEPLSMHKDKITAVTIDSVKTTY